MMGVKLRERPGKGWYVLTDWNGQRKSKYFGKNKKSAEAFADKLEARLKWAEQSGEPLALSRPDQAMPTIEDYLTDWLESHAKSFCKTSTYEEYERVIRVHLIPAFGRRILGSLKREDINRFVARYVTQRKARSTIRNYLVPLKAAYSQALEDGLVSSNPVARISRFFKRIEEHRHLPQPLTSEEIAVLLKTAKERYPLLYPVLLCAVRTGLRQSELIGLTWGAVDFHSSFVEVQQAVVRRRVTTTKSHKIRRVDMSPQLRETLQQIKELRQLEAMATGKEIDEWVFLSPQGCRWDDGNLKRTFRKCLEVSGLRVVTFHSLRHAFVSLLIEQGAHPKYIQEQAGHGSVAITLDVYGHLWPNRNKGLVDKLDEMATGMESATQPQPESRVSIGSVLSA